MPSSRALEAAEAARLESEAKSARQHTADTTTTSAAKKATLKAKASTAKSTTANKGGGKGKGKEKEKEQVIDEVDEEVEGDHNSVEQTNQPDMTLCKYAGHHYHNVAGADLMILCFRLYLSGLRHGG